MSDWRQRNERRKKDDDLKWYHRDPDKHGFDRLGTQLALGALGGPAGLILGNSLMKPITERHDLEQDYRNQAEAINPVRPTYKQSEAVDTMLAAAQTDYNTNRSAADAFYQDNIQRNVSDSVEASRRFGNAGQVLNTVSNVNANANQAYGNLATMQENRRRQAASNYQRALMAKSQEEKADYFYNQYQPFYDDLNRQRDLQRQADMLSIQGADASGELGMEAINLGTSIGTELLSSIGIDGLTGLLG